MKACGESLNFSKLGGFGTSGFAFAELAVAELAVAELAVAELAFAELAVAELAFAELAVAELAFAAALALAFSAAIKPDNSNNRSYMPNSSSKRVSGLDMGTLICIIAYVNACIK